MSSQRPQSRSSRPTTGEQEAALYAAVVVPRYASLFSRLILAELPKSDLGTVLDLGCGTGHPTFELLAHLGGGSRVIAVDHDAGLLDLARRKAFDEVGRRVFFKVESAQALSFGDQVFDAVVANLVLPHVEAPAKVLGEVRRVLAPRGIALLTTPLVGTFVELFDMYRELAVRHDRPDIVRGVERLAARHPEAEVLVAAMEGAGFEAVRVVQESVKLSYRNAGELVRDRLLELLLFPELRAIAGDGDALLAQARDALDTYFAGGPLSLTVEVGLAVGHG